MSGSERPDRLAPDHRVTVDDVRELVGPATPDKASAGKKLLSTVKGTLWTGFVLTAIFVIALKVIFG